MGEATRIEWCDHTFNPWIGCEKVSAECKHCYAEVSTPARKAAARGEPLWGPDGARHFTSAANWNLPLKWHRQALADGVRRRVFCASLADVFEDRPELGVGRDALWDLIEETPGLDWLLVTKRPENILSMVPPTWLGGFPPNVWVGTTCGTQATADARIPALIRVPAAVLFLSMEPLLERVSIADLYLPTQADRPGRGILKPLAGLVWLPGTDTGGKLVARPVATRKISWVILGGESGPRARACETQWIDAVVQDCQAAGTAVFIKQLGSYAVLDPRYDRTIPITSLIRSRTKGAQRRLAHPKGGDIQEFPPNLQLREFPRVSEVSRVG